MRLAAQQRHSRVVFVGAGLSTALGYPLGKDLPAELGNFIRARSRTAKSSFSPWKQLESELATLLRVFFHGRSLSDLRVTDFYSLAYSLSNSQRLFASTVSAPLLFSKLACVTHKYFLQLFHASRLPPDVASLLRSIDPKQHAVVTFNWDDELDVYFSRSEADVSYTLGEWQRRQRHYLLLKPHGSIGWYDVALGLRNKNAYLIAEGDLRLERSSKRIVAFNEAEPPADLVRERSLGWGVLDCPPIITPPTFTKVFEYAEQLQIWQDVIEVCSSAAHFVFLGYSLPDDDYLTRAAIAAAVNRSPAVRTRLRCLVVDRSFDSEKNRRFSEAFGATLAAENHLEWTFGREHGDQRTLGAIINERLPLARLR